MKFLDILKQEMQAIRTGQERTVLQPLKHHGMKGDEPINIIKECNPSWLTIPEYRFIAQFGRTAWARTEDLTALKMNVIREIADYVYGGVRKHIYNIERSLYTGDIREQLDALNELEEEITV